MNCHHVTECARDRTSGARYHNRNWSARFVCSCGRAGWYNLNFLGQGGVFCNGRVFKIVRRFSDLTAFRAATVDALALAAKLAVFDRLTCTLTATTETQSTGTLSTASAPAFKPRSAIPKAARPGAGFKCHAPRGPPFAAKSHEFRHENGAKCVRIFDPETGSWAEYNTAWPRVGRMREHDAVNEPAERAERKAVADMRDAP